MQNIKNLIYKHLYRLGLSFGLNNNFTNALCYHSISNSKDEYAIGLSNFKQQMKVVGNYASFIGYKQLETVLSGERINNWQIILTVDDGYQDVKKIIPLTKKLNISVILFVMSNREKVKRDELANNHRLLSIREIKQLAKLGWSIGCHSATHADLSKLTDKELEEEIVNAKKNLEKSLGLKIDYFAYPKGIVNNKILKQVKKAGFKLAFTTQPGTINSKTHPLLVPRTVITKFRNVSEFPYFFSETGLLLQKWLENLGISKALSIFK